MADVTLNVTAPNELAATLPRPFRLMGVVAATAAQQITAIQAARRSIAVATVGAQRAELLVLFAVVGRMLQIHDVRALRFWHAFQMANRSAATAMQFVK